MDDMTESDPTEMHAAKWDLKYIGLDGNIACFGMETESCNRTWPSWHKALMCLLRHIESEKPGHS